MNHFRNAAANILPGHWMKGGFNDGEGNFCALGAVRQSIRDEVGYDRENHRTVIKADRVFRDHWNFADKIAYDQGKNNAAYFNDSVLSEEDVVLFLYYVADEWDARDE